MRDWMPQLGLIPDFLKPTQAQQDASKALAEVNEMLAKAQANLAEVRVDLEDMRKAMREGKTNIKVDGKWVRLPRWSGHSGNACGASTRYPSSPPCRNLAMANGKCRMHGGKTPPYASRRKLAAKAQVEKP